MAMTNKEIKALLEQGLSHDELLAQLTKQTERSEQGLTFKVGEKGGVSIYGLNTRFPMTGYAEQWMKILDVADALRKFIVDNQATLSFKKGIPSLGIPAPAAETK